MLILNQHCYFMRHVILEFTALCPDLFTTMTVLHLHIGHSDAVPGFARSSMDDTDKQTYHSAGIVHSTDVNTVQNFLQIERRLHRIKG